MLFAPPVKVLATVPWDRRYQEERRWTVLLRAKYELYNIADGPAPLHRPPLTLEHRAKISAAIRARNLRSAAESPSVAAA